MTQKVPQTKQKSENENINKRQIIFENNLRLLEEDFGLFKDMIEIRKDPRQLQKLFDQKRNFSKLQGRDEEYKKIQEFFNQLFFCKKYSDKKHVLLVEGMTGIGKTLCIRHFQHKIIQQLKENHIIVKFVYVNAQKLKKPQQIFKIILSRLTNSREEFSSKVSQQILQHFFLYGFSPHICCTRETQIILVLDQVQSLQDMQDELAISILYKLLVYWPREIHSKFSVILATNDFNFERKLPKQIVNRVKWTKLTLSPYEPEVLQRIIKQRLEQGQHTDILKDETIKLFCQQFAKRQTNIRKFLQVLKETVKRNIDQSQSQTLQKKNSSKSIAQKIPCQKLMEVLMQKCKNDTFSDDFRGFPKPYKLVLAYITLYFRIVNPQTKSFHMISFQALYQTLMKVLKRGQENFRRIIYDLQDLKLLKIQYRRKKQPETKNNELTKKEIEMKRYEQIDKQKLHHFLSGDEMEIILMKIGIQQIVTAMNNDQSLEWLLTTNFEFPKTGILL